MVDSDKDMIEAALKWRAIMADQPVSATDRQAFTAWLQADFRHREAYEHAEKFWAGLGALERTQLDDTFFQPSWYERLRSDLYGLLQRLPNLGTGPALTSASAVAALVLALIVLPEWDASSPVDEIFFASGTGELREIALEDGSVVTLGARSEIEVHFDKERRTVTLTAGDAFFDVESDPSRPFMVIAGALRAKVLGTSFDVQLGPGESRVAVSEGLVNVTYPTVPQGARLIDEDDAAPRQTRILSSRRLAAGQQVAATTGEGLGAVSAINSASIGAWRRSRLVYYDAPLSELVADANRYQDRQILIVDEVLEDLKVSATFDGSDIDGMLATLTEVFPLRVDREAGEPIVIRARD